jgi:hypothetical protein
MEEVWQFISANAQPLSAIATFILACLTLAYVLLTRGIVIEMKNARETQLRPYIIIDFEFYKTHICNMVIKNVGNGAAFDIKTIFKPDVIYRPPDIKLSDLPVFKQLKFFPAGKEIRFFFRNMIDKSDGNIQNQFEVKLTYKDSAGKEYNDTLSLDLTWHKKLMSVVVKDLDDLAKTVEEIAKSNNKIQEQLKRLADSKE